MNSVLLLGRLEIWEELRSSDAELSCPFRLWRFLIRAVWSETICIDESRIFLNSSPWINWTLNETAVSGEHLIGYCQFPGFGHMEWESACFTGWSPPVVSKWVLESMSPPWWFHISPLHRRSSPVLTISETSGPPWLPPILFLWRGLIWILLTPYSCWPRGNPVTMQKQLLGWSWAAKHSQSSAMKNEEPCGTGWKSLTGWFRPCTLFLKISNIWKAGNTKDDYKIMELLLWHRRESLPVSDEMVNAAAGNFQYGYKIMKLLFQHQAKSLPVSSLWSSGHHWMVQHFVCQCVAVDRLTFDGFALNDPWSSCMT